MTLDDIVDSYIANYRDAARAEMRFFERLPSLQQAITHASLCHWLPSLRKHPHQYLIPNRTLALAERRLQRVASELRRASDFDALHQRIHDAIRPIKGIGALAVYDIAHRIGAFLGKPPRRVYLHRGTRVGARHLGFTGGETLGPMALPAPFARLSPAEIEDCLCIYKDDIGRLKALPKLRKLGLCITRANRYCTPNFATKFWAGKTLRY